MVREIDARQSEESIADEAMDEAIGSLIPMKVSSAVFGRSPSIDSS